MAQDTTSDKTNGAAREGTNQLPLFYKNPVPLDAKKRIFRNLE